MSAAANGPVSPNSSRLTVTDMEIADVDQPNSDCNGSISVDGAARAPAAATEARNATGAIG